MAAQRTGSAGSRSGRHRVCAVHDGAKEDPWAATAFRSLTSPRFRRTPLTRRNRRLLTCCASVTSSDGNEPDDFTVRNMTDIAEAANETSKTMTILLACIAAFAARGRHRHHEHHAGVGHRAHARDRYSHGYRRAFVGGAQSVLDRVDRAESDGRHDWHHPRRRLSLAIPAFLGWPTLVSMMAIVGSVLFSAAVGIFFGYYPAPPQNPRWYPC